MANTIPNLNGGTALTDVADGDLIPLADISDSNKAKPATALNVVSDILARGNVGNADIGGTLGVTGEASFDDRVLLQESSVTRWALISFGGALDIERYNASGVYQDKPLSFDSAGAPTFASDVKPSVTESLDLGSASLEWDNIYLQNAATVSDESRKNDLGRLDDKWVKFFDSLTAKLYTFKNRVIREAVPADKVQRPKTREVLKPSIEVVDGKAIRKMVPADEVVTELLPMFDEHGEPVLNDDGDQVLFKSKVMEWVDVPAQDEVVSKHTRPHTGFMAQAVKAAMDEAGIEDWAGYAYDKEADKHMLRYQEFIAPLLHYIQVKTR